MTTSSVHPSSSSAAIELTSSTPDSFDKSFIAAGHKLLGNAPQWRAPLDLELLKLVTNKSPYFDHARGRYWVARRAGEIVGRISAQIDDYVQEGNTPGLPKGTGQFGFFDCIDDQDVANTLFQTAEAWLREQGMTRSVGPFNPSINQEVGLLIEGFDTPNRMLMPHGFPYYVKLVESNGYRQVQEMYAYDYDLKVPLPEKFHKMVAWCDKNPDIGLRFFSKKTMSEDIDTALEIFNDAWMDNWGFVPMSQGEANAFKASLKMIIKPELAVMASYKGEDVTFIIVLPDVNELTKDMGGKLFPFNWVKLLARLNGGNYPFLRVPLLGIRKKYQRTRVGGMLPIYVIEKARANTALYHAKRSELSWILKDNPGINNMLTELGGSVYKRYGMYEKLL